MQPTPSWVLTCIHTLNVCQILPVFSLLLLLSFLLSVYPSLKQTAVTATWSSPRCGTSPRGWTSCRLRPSSPGRSFSLSTEASRTYVCLSASLKRIFIQHFLPPLSRSVPVEWWMRRHSRPSILSSFPKEVRDFLVWIIYFSLIISDLTFQHCSKSKRKKWAFPFFVVGTENILSARQQWS